MADDQHIDAAGQGRNAGRRPWRPLAGAIAAFLAGSCSCGAALALSAGPGAEPGAFAEPADASFNSAFLAGSSRHIDLSRFKHGNPVQPGNYQVDVYVNGDWIGSDAVRFEATKGLDQAQPCFSAEQLEHVGVDLEKLATPSASQGDCLPIGSWLPQATARYDSSELRLDLEVPQASMRHTPRGYVAPRYWDRGITAGVIGYTFNANRIQNRSRLSMPYRDPGDAPADGVAGSGIFPSRPVPNAAQRYRRVFDTDDSAYLNLNAGLNLGDWQLRHDSSTTWQSGRGARWQNIDTYARRNIASIRSLLTVGEANTSGEFFDAVGFRGAQLAFDDRMLPDSLRGYAPVVRGVANTNARVEIYQNGYVIYQTTVAPGAFEINDLYPTGYSGDLEVRVTEADGAQRSFSVPYSSVAQLLRPGIGRYSLTLGQLRDYYVHGHPFLVQGTYQRGLSNLFTGYAGAVLTRGYDAILLGGAFNTEAGAFSVDLTQARTQLPGSGTSSGQSVKLGYSKLVSETRTNFAVAAYRYSTSGYLSLQDALQARELARQGGEAGTVLRQRSRFELTVNQSLGAGSLYVTGSAIDYWRRGGTQIQYQAGYSNHLGRLSYAVSASRTRDLYYGRSDTQYMLNVSLPLGSGMHAPNANASLAHDSQGYSTTQLGLSGTAGPDHNLNYNLSAGNDTRGGTNGSLNGQYLSPYTALTAAYAQGSGYRQASLGASGGVVIHSGGLTFSPQSGETMALIEAKHAKGAQVTNYAGVRIDGHGYALVPYLIPYNLNTVQIDPKGIAADVQLQSTSQQVAPYAGAVVKLSFATVAGRAVLLHALRAHGETIPFGAQVANAQGQVVGVVGQGSRLFLRGLPDSGFLKVTWGDGQGQQCRIDYRLPAADHRSSSGYYSVLEAPCAAAAAGPSDQSRGEAHG